MCEFSVNNANLETTGVSPFFANYGSLQTTDTTFWIKMNQSLVKGPEDSLSQKLVKTLRKLQDVSKLEMA